MVLFGLVFERPSFIRTGFRQAARHLYPSSRPLLETIEKTFRYDRNAIFTSFITIVRQHAEGMETHSWPRKFHRQFGRRIVRRTFYTPLRPLNMKRFGKLFVTTLIRCLHLLSQLNEVPLHQRNRVRLGKGIGTNRRRKTEVRTLSEVACAAA